jgi:hypothetical protein
MTEKNRGCARHERAVLSLAVLFGLGACGPERDLSLPEPEQVVSYYDYEGAMEAEIVGNVAVLTVEQSAEQLRRGGNLWAKVGPYIFLFSEETLRLFEDYGGLGGVRVITRVGSAEVANALLPREELTDVLWRRSLNISGLARRDGTARMTLLEDLVEWGEDHTEFTYNPRFTRR